MRPKVGVLEIPGKTFYLYFFPTISPDDMPSMLHSRLPNTSKHVHSLSHSDRVIRSPKFSDEPLNRVKAAIEALA